MLGFLHKRVLGMAHPSFDNLFPFASSRDESVVMDGRPRHNKQLHNHASTIMFREQLWRRSIFGLVYSYNKLLQHVIDCPSIAEFQSALIQQVKFRYEQGDSSWFMHLDAKENCIQEGRYASFVA